MAIFQSINPVTQTVIWEGELSTAQDVDKAVNLAHETFQSWRHTTFDERLALLQQYQVLLEANQDKMARAISDEVGKPYWEAKTEVATMVAKLAISVSAYQDRTPVRMQEVQGSRFVTHHRPHGVMGVIGPFNFPGHLPTGHIIPCLLAGNTVVFKPSELTPYVGEFITDLFLQAGLPEGVVNLVQGGGQIGQALTAHPLLNGLLFTGSYATGKKIHEQFAGYPEKILALEMGGNNPLLVDELQDIKAAILNIIQSAYLSAGQRCTCARRLIVPEGSWGDQLIERLSLAVERIVIDQPYAEQQPFYSSLISAQAGEQVLAKQKELLNRGGKALLTMKVLQNNSAILSPGLMDVTGLPRQDEEIFGPFLQIIRVKNFESGIEEANHTQYGLTSGILTDNKKHYEVFYERIHAGLVNWNRPTTGSTGVAPFGGVGHSGNHRPSAYYAADYAAYPCVAGEMPLLRLPETLPHGISL